MSGKKKACLVYALTTSGMTIEAHQGKNTVTPDSTSIIIFLLHFLFSFFISSHHRLRQHSPPFYRSSQLEEAPSQTATPSLDTVSTA